MKVVIRETRQLVKRPWWITAAWIFDTVLPAALITLTILITKYGMKWDEHFRKWTWAFSLLLFSYAVQILMGLILGVDLWKRTDKVFMVCLPLYIICSWVVVISNFIFTVNTIVNDEDNFTVYEVIIGTYSLYGGFLFRLAWTPFLHQYLKCMKHDLYHHVQPYKNCRFCRKNKPASGPYKVVGVYNSNEVKWSAVAVAIQMRKMKCDASQQPSRPPEDMEFNDDLFSP